MKEGKKITPPKWAASFLSWYCRPELLEDLQGDLNEYFDRNLNSHGKRKARLIYILDVFKFMRLYTIRKPEFINLLISWIMIGSYIKTSGRNIVRNKLFSTINIIGLAISMAVGLVMITILSDILSYDKFHVNHSRIYRVVSRYQFLENKDDDFVATTSMKAGKLIKEDFAVPEAVAILKREFGGDITAGEKTIPLSGFWSNESLFNVFTFELVAGNEATALKDPFSIVLTETSAKKLFGSTDVIGKVLTLNKDKQYTVTGVVKDLPFFSNIRFDVLGSLSTRDIIAKDDKHEMKWDSVWDTWVYVLLPVDADLSTFKKNLDELSVKEDKTVKNSHVELALQSFDKIMLDGSMGNEIGPVMGSTALWIFGGLSFVVLLSACFNYANLSIARSLRRTREVGIRKVIGALKSQVVNQFVVEAVLISLAALVLAFILFFFLKNYYLDMDPGIRRMTTLQLSPSSFVYFIAFALIIGISAGLFPALFFSRVNPAQVLKNFSSVLQFKKLTLRKALIVFQYTISIIFITSTIVIFKQYKHYMSYDLGFSTENILNISLQGNKADLIRKDLEEFPEVKEISESLIVTSVGNYWGSRMKYHINPDDSTTVYYNTVDENYLPLHGHKLLAGRNFQVKADSAVENEVIVNEQVLKRFSIAEKNPARAIGEVVTIDGKDMTIIGVMKDYSYGRANDKNEAREVAIRYSNRNARFLNVKIQSSDPLLMRTKIEAIWKKHDSVHPLEARFYTEQLEEAFAGLKAAVRIAGFLALLAICIASMGLLGMVVFTTETRLKEISIRKIMGATEAGLMLMLGKGFIILLGVATLIAVPITVLFFEKILFQEIGNHAPLSLPEMLLGVLAVLLLALVMIGSQTLKVSRTNPAEVLKSE